MKDKQSSPDICGKIHSHGKIDPFEGLDLNNICVPPQNEMIIPQGEPVEEEKKSTLFDLNPLENNNLEGLSATGDIPAPEFSESIPQKPPEPRKQKPTTQTTQTEDAINFVIVPELQPKSANTDTIDPPLTLDDESELTENQQAAEPDFSDTPKKSEESKPSDKDEAIRAPLSDITPKKQRKPLSDSTPPPSKSSVKRAIHLLEKSLSTEVAAPPVKLNKTFINPIIEKAYHYAELTQIREKIFKIMEAKDGNVLLIASPHDNTGSSLLTASLGYNSASSCQKKVLLIDCNMRRAGLHTFFNVEQSYGFTDLIKDNVPWQAVTKETGIENLKIITAGDHCDNFSDFLRYSHIPNLVKEIHNQFDLIIFDTSPVLTPNRNNVNIVSLTSVVDYFLLVTKKSGTTKDHLKETINIIESGNGHIDGIVLNEHTPEKKAVPYS